MNKSENPKFELVNQAEAAAEKKVESHLAGIGVAFNGARRAGVQLVGQMVIAGSHMNDLMELLPHGDMEKRIAERYPDLSKATQHRWRNLSFEVLEAVKTKCPTMRLLSAKGKLRGGKKNEAALLEIIPAILQGRNVTEFLQDCKLLRAPQLKGGERIPKDLAKKFCESCHPEMPLAACLPLPGKLKKEYYKWEATQTNNAVTEAETADRMAQDQIAQLRSFVADPNPARLCKLSTLKDLVESKDALGRFLQDTLALRKQTHNSNPINP